MDPFTDNIMGITPQGLAGYFFSYSDFDKDGITDADDWDDDNDGILDVWEMDEDLDGNGLINRYDLDSDNDGCLDSYEAGYTDQTETVSWVLVRPMR